MEPRQNRPASPAEIAPVRTNELGVPTGYEQGGQSQEVGVENRPEVGAVQAEIAQVVMPALPTPVVSNDDTQVTADPAATPSVAGDDDLIEKEWVDKAKQIIAATKDDPYKREREISKLQIEYIRKRYGREVGDSGD